MPQYPCSAVLYLPCWLYRRTGCVRRAGCTRYAGLYQPCLAVLAYRAVALFVVSRRGFLSRLLSSFPIMIPGMVPYRDMRPS